MKQSHEAIEAKSQWDEAVHPGKALVEAQPLNDGKKIEFSVLKEKQKPQ